MRAVALAAVLLFVLAGTAFARDPKDPTLHAVAADVKTANAIGLRLSDFVAGWKHIKADTSSSTCKAEPDESKLLETADVDPTFQSANGAVQVDSEVMIFKTSAMALTDWRFATAAIGQACLAEIAGKGAKVTVTAMRPTVKAQRTKGFHITAVLPANGGTITGDIIAMGKGRTTAVVSAVGPKGAYNANALAPLISKLAARLAGTH
jgi:hypothetical protein